MESLVLGKGNRGWGGGKEIGGGEDFFMGRKVKLLPRQSGQKEEKENLVKKASRKGTEGGGERGKKSK